MLFQPWTELATCWIEPSKALFHLARAQSIRLEQFWDCAAHGMLPCLQRNSIRNLWAVHHQIEVCGEKSKKLELLGPLHIIMIHRLMCQSICFVQHCSREIHMCWNRSSVTWNDSDVFGTKIVGNTVRRTSWRKSPNAASYPSVLLHVARYSQASHTFFNTQNKKHIFQSWPNIEWIPHAGDAAATSSSHQSDAFATSLLLGYSAGFSSVCLKIVMVKQVMQII